VILKIFLEDENFCENENFPEREISRKFADFPLVLLSTEMKKAFS